MDVRRPTTQEEGPTMFVFLTSPFCGATDNPVLDFWWCLPWISKQRWIPHLWNFSPVCCFLRFISGASPADLLLQPYKRLFDPSTCKFIIKPVLQSVLFLSFLGVGWKKFWGKEKIQFFFIFFLNLKTQYPIVSKIILLAAEHQRKLNARFHQRLTNNKQSVVMSTDPVAMSTRILLSLSLIRDLNKVNRCKQYYGDLKILVNGSKIKRLIPDFNLFLFFCVFCVKSLIFLLCEMLWAFLYGTRKPSQFCH